MPASDIVARLRLQNQRQFVSGADAAARSVRGIGEAGERTEGRLRRAGSAATSAAGTGFMALARAARTGAIALGGAAVAAGAVGIKFNANMEQNTVAFTSFLGSTTKAKAYLDDLYKTAANTPFEFPQLVGAARKFLAFGFSAAETNKVLATVGDTVSGIGGGAEEIDRLTMAFGQIQAKGKLSTEELLQMAELGVPVFSILRKEFNMTGKELEDSLRKGTIGADKAVAALMKGMDAKFKGSSAKQAKTFSGQLSTLKDNATGTLGTLTKPLFDSLSKNVLPKVNQVVNAMALGAKKDGFGGAIKAARVELEKLGVSDAVFDKFNEGLKLLGKGWAELKKQVTGAKLKEAGTELKSALGPLKTIWNVLRDLWEIPGVKKAVIILGGVIASVKLLDKVTGGAVSSGFRFASTMVTIGVSALSYMASLNNLRAARLAHTGAETAGTLATIRAKIAELGAAAAAKVRAVATALATGAIRLYTAATNGSIIATTRAKVASIAMAVATRAQALATRAAAVAQRLFNLALMMNPIGLVIAAIVLLVVGVIAAYKKFAWFRAGVKAVWGGIKSAISLAVRFIVASPMGWLVRGIISLLRNFGNLKSGIASAWGSIKRGAMVAVNFVRGKFNGFMTFINGLPGRVTSALSGIWNGLKDGLQSVLDSIVGQLNRLINIANKIPGVDISPIGGDDAPGAARGGVIKQAGWAKIGERGPELLRLPKAATVFDARQTRAALTDAAPRGARALDKPKGAAPGGAQAISESTAWTAIPPSASSGARSLDPSPAEPGRSKPSLPTLAGESQPLARSTAVAQPSGQGALQELVRDGESPMVVHSHLYVDGREMATNVGRHAADRKARK